MSSFVCQLLQVQQGIRAVEWQKKGLKMPSWTCQDDLCPASVVMMWSRKNKRAKIFGGEGWDPANLYNRQKA